jgi:ABC-type bacteriocin/lantibiotic exporter with double-glycine peptidase domain
VRAPLLISMVAGCLLASACGHVSSRAFDRMEADPDWVIVRGVPVVRQTSANDCGAAALAMVLTFWGQPTSLRDVTAVYPSAPDGGILAGHLRDFARTKNVSAFLIAGTVDDLGKELASGRPVLVGTVRDSLGKRYSHYQVVIGLNRKGQRVLINDPAKGRQEVPWADFASTWVAGKQLALVILPKTQATH